MPRPRWIISIALVLLALVVGFLLAVLVPRDADETKQPTPVLITTATIPPAEP